MQTYTWLSLWEKSASPSRAKPSAIMQYCYDLHNKHPSTHQSPYHWFIWALYTIWLLASLPYGNKESLVPPKNQTPYLFVFRSTLLFEACEPLLQCDPSFNTPLLTVTVPRYKASFLCVMGENSPILSKRNFYTTYAVGENSSMTFRSEGFTVYIVGESSPMTFTW